MKAAKLVLGSLAATIVIGSCVIGPWAFAQQSTTGMITQIDRLNGTIAIQQTQSGTVGANTGGAQGFKVQDTKLLENFHAGDRVTFSATDDSGAKTITQLKKQ
jgi:Cu/Ag efflux protein CusF